MTGIMPMQPDRPDASTLGSPEYQKLYNAWHSGMDLRRQMMSDGHYDPDQIDSQVRNMLLKSGVRLPVEGLEHKDLPKYLAKLAAAGEGPMTPKEQAVGELTTMANAAGAGVASNIDPDVASAVGQLHQQSPVASAGYGLAGGAVPASVAGGMGSVGGRVASMAGLSGIESGSAVPGETWKTHPGMALAATTAGAAVGGAAQAGGELAGTVLQRALELKSPSPLASVKRVLGQTSEVVDHNANVASFEQRTPGVEPRLLETSPEMQKHAYDIAAKNPTAAEAMTKKADEMVEEAYTNRDAVAKQYSVLDRRLTTPETERVLADPRLQPVLKDLHDSGQLPGAVITKKGEIRVPYQKVTARMLEDVRQQITRGPAWRVGMPMQQGGGGASYGERQIYKGFTDALDKELLQIPGFPEARAEYGKASELVREREGIQSRLKSLSEHTRYTEPGAETEGAEGATALPRSFSAVKRIAHALLADPGSKAYKTAYDVGNFMMTGARDALPQISAEAPMSKLHTLIGVGRAGAGQAGPVGITGLKNLLGLQGQP